MKITKSRLQQIIKEEIQAEMKKNIAYSGVVLDQDSVGKLKAAAKAIGVPEGFVFQTKAEAPLPHHMTIVAFKPIKHPKGKHDFSEDYPVGGEVELTVTEIGYDDKAMAAKVIAPGPISEKISFPHITIAINPGKIDPKTGEIDPKSIGKPYDSNKIPADKFQKIGQFTVRGTVQEVPQG